MKRHLIMLALAIGASSSLIDAQEGNPPAGGPPGGSQRQPGGSGGQRPAGPVIEALDLNKDGVIDAGELAKAVESLKKLDKNGDGKLTEDEYRPQRPGGPGGQGRGPGGGGPGRQGGPGQGGPSQGGAAPGGDARPQRPALEP